MSFFSKRHKDKHNDKASKDKDSAPPAANPPMNFGQQQSAPSPPQPPPSLNPPSAFDDRYAYRAPQPHPQSDAYGGPSPALGGSGGFQDPSAGMSREQQAHQQMMLDQRKVSGGQQQPQSPQQSLTGPSGRKPVASLPGPPPAPSAGSNEIQFPWCVAFPSPSSTSGPNAYRRLTLIV